MRQAHTRDTRGKCLCLSYMHTQSHIFRPCRSCFAPVTGVDLLHPLWPLCKLAVVVVIWLWAIFTLAAGNRHSSSCVRCRILSDLNVFWPYEKPTQRKKKTVCTFSLSLLFCTSLPHTVVIPYLSQPFSSALQGPRLQSFAIFVPLVPTVKRGATWRITVFAQRLGRKWEVAEEQLRQECLLCVPEDLAPSRSLELVQPGDHLLIDLMSAWKKWILK